MKQVADAFNRKRASLWMGACLLLTGIAGLVLEVVWSREVENIVGSSASAQVLVVCVYMAGLALGSWLLGPFADRVARPQILYAGLELGVGLYALAFSWLSEKGGELFEWAARGHYETHPVWIGVLRLAIAVGLVLPATVAMGGTLPAAARFVGAWVGEAKRVVARLYFLNSLGAAAGAVGAAYLLIPAWGLAGASALASGLELLAAAVAFGFGSRLEVSDPPGASAPSPQAPARLWRLAAAVVALTGFSALALEVAWLRFFSLVLGSSAQAFAVMLSAYILGIALGSALVSRPWADRVEPLRLLSVLLAVGIALLGLSLPLYERAAFWLATQVAALPKTASGYQAFLGLGYAGCLALMLPCTLVLGAALPVAARAAELSRGAGRKVGFVWATNTLGTILGAVCSFFLMRTLGLRGVFLGALGVLWGAAGLLVFGAEKRRRAFLLNWAVAGGVALVAFVAGPWNRTLLTSALFRLTTDDATLASYQRNTVARLTELYGADGSGATVTVTQEGPTRTLRINGKPDATNSVDMVTQTLVGELPMLFRPAAKEALVIGLGSGVTSGVLLAHPLERLDLVELIPEVVEASHLFEDVNRKALRDPRTHLWVDDAKNFLRLSSRKYDVIVSEPTNPWIAGVGGLFSSEYYQRIDRVLAPGGVFVQWFQMYETSDAVLALMARTLLARFPYVYGFESAWSDMVVVASREPLALDAGNARAALARPEVGEVLGQAGLAAELESLLGRQVISPVGLAAFAGPGELNTDRHPLLEYRAPVEFFTRNTTDIFRIGDERRVSDGSRLFISSLGEEGRKAARRLVHRSEEVKAVEAQVEQVEQAVLMGRGLPDTARMAVVARAMALEERQDAFSPRPPYDELVARASRLAEAPGAQVVDRSILATVLLQANRFPEALVAFDEIIRRVPPRGMRASWLAHRARAKWALGDAAGARADLAQAEAEGASFAALARVRLAMALGTGPN